MSRIIDRATDDQIEDLLQDKPDDLRRIYISTHRLILETLPDVTHETDRKDGSTGYGIRQYGYDGWGMMALSAHSKWVTLVFMHGVDLEDPHKLLEGTGKKLRHVKLRSLDQVSEHKGALQALIRAATRLNQATD